MKIKSLATVAALGVLAVASSTPARAAFIYENTPLLTSGQAGNCVYNTSCGSSTYLAQEFTLAAAAQVGSIGWNSIVSGGTVGTNVTWEILRADGSAGLPGSLVASGYQTVSSTAGPVGALFATTDYTVSLPFAQSLSAGSYYLALQLVTTNSNDSLSAGVAGTGAVEGDGNSSWTSESGSLSMALCSGGGPCNIGASAPSVPEPMTLSVLPVGLLGLAVSRRLRGGLSAG